jgi:hypothetical protein
MSAIVRWFYVYDVAAARLWTRLARYAIRRGREAADRAEAVIR